MRRSLKFLAAALCACSCTLSAQIGSPKLPDVDWTQNLGGQVPLDTVFYDLDDQPVALDEVIGERPVILALVYFECPMLCDLVMNGLLSSLRSLSFDAGKEFDVVVIGIDPDESAAVARSQSDGYIERYGRAGSEGAWHFLRGDKDSIDAVADAVGYQYSYVPETDEYAHPAGLAILTPGGKLARILYGSEFGSRDLKFSLMEASNGTIGSPMEKIILRCFHYDPSRGEYGFAIIGSLRITGSIRVAFLAFIIVRMIRSDKKRSVAVTPNTGAGTT